MSSKVSVATSYGGVLGDTPLIIKVEGIVQTIRIDELFEGEVERLDVEVWQNGKFVRINKMRKYTSKKQIVRVLTGFGIVDCTSDYKLLKSNGKTYFPEEFQLKSMLMHQTDDSALLKSIKILPNEIECKEALEMGAFLRFGSCCELSAESGRDWLIEDADEKYLLSIKKRLGFPTVVYEPIPPLKKFQLRLLCDERPIVQRYRETFYNKHGELRVPSFIMQSKIEVVASFWDGYSKTKNTVTARSKQLATDIWLIARRLGLNVAVCDCSSLEDEEYDCSFFELHCLSREFRFVSNEIKRISEIHAAGEENLVYNLETESGRFSIGPGNLVLGSK